MFEGRNQQSTWMRVPWSFAGLVMLSDEMAATLLAGMPESPQLVKA